MNKDLKEKVIKRINTALDSLIFCDTAKVDKKKLLKKDGSFDVDIKGCLKSHVCLVCDVFIDKSDLTKFLTEQINLLKLLASN